MDNTENYNNAYPEPVRLAAERRLAQDRAQALIDVLIKYGIPAAIIVGGFFFVKRYFA